MEEKERYTIESFEIEEPPVIFDNKTQQIILTLVDYNYDEITHLKDLLNHYFKRIKELEKENQKANIKNYLTDYYLVEKENQQLKQQLSDEEKAHDFCIDSFNEECEKLRKQIKFESEARERFKQSQNEKENEILKKVVDFINELAWHDVQYDAFQSTMGEFPASPSAIPIYAKKYFNLWKEMFNENLEDKIKNWEQNNGRIYKELFRF